MIILIDLDGTLTKNKQEVMTMSNLKTVLVNNVVNYLKFLI